MKDYGTFIFVCIIGIFCIAIGISNMKGNISSLHRYHRHRISEEDRIPFGKKVGLGTVISGCAVTVQGVFSAIGLYVQNDVFTRIGSIVSVAGLVIGIGISVYAIIKYNKGLF